MSDFLRRLAEAFGERVAVSGEESELSFRELDQAADAWAGAFVAAGLGTGRHIALLAGNGPEWLAIAFGVWRAGATLVPISTFVTARELGETLSHSDSDALVLVPRLRSHDYLELLAHLPPLPRLKRVIVLDDEAPLPYLTEAQFLSSESADVCPRLDPEGAACILYTSGTTGQPKGVMLSHRAILATIYPTAERSGLNSEDSLLSTLPLFWVAGLVIRALPTLAAGCALLLVETFSVDTVIAALRCYRPTALHLRPPQVGQVLGHPDFDPEYLANVRKGNGRTEWFGTVLSGEARFITGYGMTEMAGYVTALHWQDPPEATPPFGRPLPGIEIRVVGADGKDSTAGEIRVRGPGMFSGYYKEEPGNGTDGGGWFVTGDLGRVDADGTVHFVGRAKDLLRVKGINVSPLEVEAILSGHPSVETAYVVGLPADGFDQRLVALIVPRENGAGRGELERRTEADLRAVAAEQLSHYKRPEAYVFIDRGTVPLSGTSKPQRQSLAALAASRLEKDAPQSK